jgi:hypothetical protein
MGSKFMNARKDRKSLLNLMYVLGPKTNNEQQVLEQPPTLCQRSSVIRAMELELDRFSSAVDAGIVKRVTSEEAVRQSGVRRFNRFFDVLEAQLPPPRSAEAFENTRGQPIVRIKRSGSATTLVIDEEVAPNFGAFLIDRLQSLLYEFEAKVGEQTK